MKRAPAGGEPEARFDPKAHPRQKVYLETVYRQVFAWAQGCVLNPNPIMPPELRNRAADNWRVLISIADAFGPEWGKAARAAALELSEDLDEDQSVRILADIRTVFDVRGADRMASAALVAGLLELPDSPWGEWRGPEEIAQP